jgi:cytochrome c oxidase subunit 4
MSDQHHEETHVVEYGQYIYIWLGLLAFTGITVTVSGINLGNWTIVIALLIASIKSYYVLNYFMHLSYEDKIFKAFVLTAFLTFFIFLSFTFWDYSFMR